MIPERVDARIRYLLRRGRRVEALALARLEWEEPNYLEWLNEQVNAMATAISSALLPALNSLANAFTQAALAISSMEANK